MLRYMKGTRSPWLIVAAVIALAAIVVACYFAFISPHYSRLIQMRMLELTASAHTVGDIKDATYLLSSWNGGGIYHGGTLDYSAYLDRGALVTDVAKSNGHVASISVNPKTGETEVSLDGVVIAASSLHKAKVAISPDGSKVAFAQATTLTSADWAVSVIDAAGARELGPGFGALFLDDSTVVRFEAGKVVGEDLVTGEEIGAVPTTISSNRFFISQSPDRKLLVWRDEKDELVTIYEVVGTMPLTLESVTFVETVRGALALTNDALYVTTVSAYKGKTYIWKYDLAKEETPAIVRTLPENLSLAKLIP